MSATSASSPSRAEPREQALAALAVAVVLFALAWWLLHVGVLGRGQIVDTPVYEAYGDAMLAGRVPYRDFAVEYPPAALPVFVLPALAPGGAYRAPFEALMSLCGAGALAAAAWTLRSLRAPAAPALAAIALGPLLLGSVVLTRFDLWPAALAALALAALAAGRDRLGHGALGLAVAAKVYPAVLVPLALAWVWRRRGRGEALRCAAVLAAVVAACLLPFVALAPGGVWSSVARQAARPLQLESLGAALLLAWHRLGGGGALRMETSHGSQNLVGAGAGALATASGALQLAALVALWVAFARGPASAPRLVRYAAAAVCAFVALGKVLSPQYLVWLVPLVPLVRGRRGVAATAVLAVALLLTQLEFPHRYWPLALRFAATPGWLVLARDLALVALLVVLATPRRARAR